MAHKVTFSAPKAEVRHSDFAFLVYRNGGMFGKLLVSKGAVVWRPRSKSWRGRKLGWLDFQKIMQKHGRPEHRRRRSRNTST
jgi:hypothetical protein